MKQDNKNWKSKIVNVNGTLETSVYNNSPLLKMTNPSTISTTGFFKLDQSNLEINIKSKENDEEVLDPDLSDDVLNEETTKNLKKTYLKENGEMKYLSIPITRHSLCEKSNELEINSAEMRFENKNEFLLTSQINEVLSEKGDREEKEVNVFDLINKMQKLHPKERYRKLL